MLNRAQYCLLRCVGKAGLPAELMSIFLARCGATVQDWQPLLDAALVQQVADGKMQRYTMTPEGKRAYARRPNTLYF